MYSTSDDYNDLYKVIFLEKQTNANQFLIEGFYNYLNRIFDPNDTTLYNLTGYKRNKHNNISKINILKKYIDLSTNIEPSTKIDISTNFNISNKIDVSYDVMINELYDKNINSSYSENLLIDISYNDNGTSKSIIGNNIFQTYSESIYIDLSQSSLRTILLDNSGTINLTETIEKNVWNNIKKNDEYEHKKMNLHFIYTKDELLNGFRDYNLYDNIDNIRIEKFKTNNNDISQTSIVRFFTSYIYSWNQITDMYKKYDNTFNLLDISKFEDMDTTPNLENLNYTYTKNG